MKRFFSLLILAGSGLLYLNSQPYIAGHTVALESVLRAIPETYINQARNNFVVAYEHTSHGTHVSRGVFGLQDYKAGDDALFGVSLQPEEGKLEFRDYALHGYAPGGVTAVDLSTDETAFIQTTRNYLDAPQNASVNLIMWSWCDIAGHDVAGNYLPGMDSLISEYGYGGTKIGTGAGQREVPVHFIFMTGHANSNANAGEGNPKEQAKLITDHCTANGYFCLDYYSIDTHDMEGTYYEDAGDDGKSDSYGGNYYQDWQDAHTLGVDYFENKEIPGGNVATGAHTDQHITANRKAYAFWWILARMAGWEGEQEPVLAESIGVLPQDGVTSVLEGEQLQFMASVLPEDATDPTVSWEVENVTGSATITGNGLLTAAGAGIVNVVATAVDGSGVSGSIQIHITESFVPVGSVRVGSSGEATEMTVGGTLRFYVEVEPANATDKSVSWSVTNLTGEAEISEGGVLTAHGTGAVMVSALANDGSGASDSLEITINDSVVKATEIEVIPEGGLAELVVGHTMRFHAEVLPANASTKVVSWGVVEVTGEATMDSTGLLTALGEGIVTVVANATDSSGVSGSLQITLVAPVPVNELEITEQEGRNSMALTDTLYLEVVVQPENATNREVTWSVSNLTGSAVVTQEGVLTAVSAGKVQAKVIARDGSGVTSEYEVQITDPFVQVTGLTILAPGGVDRVSVGGSLQLAVEVEPVHATATGVAWEITGISGEASIDGNGLLTGLAEGMVRVEAWVKDCLDVRDSLLVEVVDWPVPASQRPKDAFSVFPVPAGQWLYLDHLEEGTRRILLTDTRGRILREWAPAPGQDRLVISLGDALPGVYLLILEGGEKTIVRKIIKALDP